MSEDEKYQKFLNELQSYVCGNWNRFRKRRIREVFVVGSITNPEIGKIDKLCIETKSADFMELADCSRFDLKTGRSLNGEAKYIFPVENRLVWDAWEPQSLRQRVERVLPALPFKAVRAYADLLHPNWHFGIFTEKLDRMFGRNFDRPAASLSEREEARMASCRKLAKETVMDHLPGAIQEFRALVEMMEGDAR